MTGNGRNRHATLSQEKRSAAMCYPPPLRLQSTDIWVVTLMAQWIAVRKNLRFGPLPLDLGFRGRFLWQQ